MSLVVMNVEMSVEMGMLKETSPAIPLPPLHPINNTPNNQSKPIVPTLSSISL